MNSQVISLEYNVVFLDFSSGVENPSFNWFRIAMDSLSPPAGIPPGIEWFAGIPFPHLLIS